ncbi:hypothetical protein C5167_009563 [Papaver somniferum]|uniref:Uncharacterized protein n=1 Tax=Papaver somniferum TaxID=3469 RepID=A0A4Y7K0U5_PAPSO|nr:hypothetical protein C5167_009563 [Papaver somniferum]
MQDYRPESFETNLEKALMQAMLKLTEEKQKRMKKKVINMDFEINPNLKLPHQLMLKNQENGGEVLVETLPLNQTQIIPSSIPIFPLPASISRSSPLAIPFPSALNPAKLHVTDDALFDLPLNILFPSTADRNVGSSSESLQIYPLRSCTKAQYEKWTTVVNSNTDNGASISSTMRSNSAANQSGNTPTREHHVSPRSSEVETTTS